MSQACTFIFIVLIEKSKNKIKIKIYLFSFNSAEGIFKSNIKLNQKITSLKT